MKPDTDSPGEGRSQRDLTSEAAAGNVPLFVRRLSRALARPLPGREAQYRMAPQPRYGKEPGQHSRQDARRGGVLVLLYPHEGQLHLPFILRSTYIGVHSGQVGFPGGGYEECDADLIQTALREAREELGVEAAQVDVLGNLSYLYIAPSNYLVLPTVGWTSCRPHFHPDPYEVEKLIEIPLADLTDPANLHRENWQLREGTATVPFFAVKNQTVWGATAMILSEFLTIVENL